MKFKYTVGIELTGVPKVPFDMMIRKIPNPYNPGSFYEATDWDQLTRIKEKISRDLFGLYGGEDIAEPYAEPYIDSHCFEVPSPVFKDKESMKKWFLVVRRVMKKHGLKPHHDDVVCGGGHIHVGLDHKTHGELREKVIRSIRRDYFLPWVFSQPDDTESCCNGGFGKDSSYYSNFSTIEFRFFESALSWSEQWDHIVFVNKYINHINKSKYLERKYGRWPYGKKELNKISQRKAIEDFQKLLKQIGLPYKRYKKYVERNLKPRWELDRVRV